MKKLALWLLILSFVFFFSQYSHAENITIIYSAGVKASLYPADDATGVGPLGGVSRRATKIKQLRKTFPSLLLVEGGNSFAGARDDANRVNENLDASRTLIYLKNLEMMGYDTVGIGQDEYNFTDRFLEDVMTKMDLNFLSCNTKIKGARPFLRKKIDNFNVGIINITIPGQDPYTTDPTQGLKSAVNELKDKKSDVIIVLSQLGEKNDKVLAEQVSGIHLIIGTGDPAVKKVPEKVNSVFLIRLPSGPNELSKISLEMQKGQIVNVSVEKVALDNRVEDDSEINNLIPRCYSDKDCQRPGARAACQNPGEKIANCVFQESVNVKMLAITPKRCRTCRTDYVVDGLRNMFPGLEVQPLASDDPQAKKLIDELKIEMLPAYVLSNQVEKDPNFSQFNKIADLINGQYYLKPSFSGVSYLIQRKPEAGRLDFFVALTHRDMPQVLKVTKELLDQKKDKIKFQLHLVGAKNPETGEFLSPGGVREINEDKIYACVDQYYPQKSWDYLSCRTADVENLWWEDCLEKNGMETKKIKECARGEEGNKLFQERIKLAEELNITYAPLFLVDNVEIFGANRQTTAAEILSVLEPQETTSGKTKK